MMRTKFTAIVGAAFITMIIFMKIDVFQDEYSNPIKPVFDAEEIESVDAGAESASSTVPVLEDKYVSSEKSVENGVVYIIEKYEEYEVYTDENGREVKSLPTGHYSYIRYKR
ncbi:hypothetical protein GJU40_06895 [Bacillus lacus]|uniref:Uncharacterized protein n=1 Tax=Metabacillus lacus TaxID=1983721 RepID=A0A7X2LZN7_9BACI|nr:hypothetical protein [Metabacillus lacus]MRX71899.1 hypothetical protein [Metabacillus lacus]